MSTTSEASSVEEAWQKYPANLEHYDPIAVDGPACITRLDGLSDVIFSKGTNLEVVDLFDTSALSRREIENEEALDVFLGANLPSPSLRIVHVILP